VKATPGQRNSGNKCRACIELILRQLQPRNLPGGCTVSSTSAFKEHGALVFCRSSHVAPVHAPGKLTLDPRVSPPGHCLPRSGGEAEPRCPQRCHIRTSSGMGSGRDDGHSSRTLQARNRTPDRFARHPSCKMRRRPATLDQRANVYSGGGGGLKLVAIPPVQYPSKR
jgi:hypothetical protein